MQGSTKGSIKAGKRTSVRLSRNGSEGEPEDIITKILWTDADVSDNTYCYCYSPVPLLLARTVTRTVTRTVIRTVTRIPNDCVIKRAVCYDMLFNNID